MLAHQNDKAGASHPARWQATTPGRCRHHQRSRLIARIIDGEHLGVYASPAYLARLGTPLRPSDLEAHECVGYRLQNSGRNRGWQFQVDGRSVEISPRIRYQFSDGEGLVAAAGQGLGLVQVRRYMAAAALEA